MKLYLCFSMMLAFFSVNIAQTTNKENICQMKAKEQWRVYADSGRYNEAIDILLDSIQKSKHKDQKKYYWHIGQLYACIDEYDTAIDYLKKSAGFFDTFIDREWRLYYRGTIAFLKKDKRKLYHYTDKLWNKHSAYNYSNACRLKALYENFETPYRVAFKKPCK